jgi:hypothetical protein
MWLAPERHSQAVARGSEGKNPKITNRAIFRCGASAVAISAGRRVGSRPAAAWGLKKGHYRPDGVFCLFTILGSGSMTSNLARHPENHRVAELAQTRV